MIIFAGIWVAVGLVFSWLVVRDRVLDRLAMFRVRRFTRRELTYLQARLECRNSEVRELESTWMLPTRSGRGW